MFSSFSQLLTRESGEIEVLSLEQVNLPNLSVTALWDSNGSIICSESDIQENPKICSNEDDGAIIVWRDRRNESSDGNIYAQRFLKDGFPQWKANGTAVCTAIDQQSKPEICSDGLGGAFITWVDERNITGIPKIYIQRVTELGFKPFTANGKIIEPLGGDQSEVKICSDGANGAFIVWVDNKNLNDDIFAQRIDKDGNLLWFNEAEVCTEFSHQSGIQIINDGQGGLIITWEDSRGNSDIYAQKLNSSGSLLWAPNGTLVCNEENQQLEPQLCNDGLGGVIITWYDYRDGLANIDIYAQRINSGGTVLWNTNGSIVNVENNVQKKCKICSDGNGGAIVTWYDKRSGIDFDIYAQKINSNGNRVWLSSGIPICTEDEDQYYPEICSDGFGGAVIAWKDMRGMYADIYSQRIDASSKTYWTAGGTPVTVAGDNQVNVRLIPDNFGGAIFTWEDYRDGYSNSDIYAQRLKEHPIVTINSPVSHALFSYTAPSFNVEYLDSDLDDMWYTLDEGLTNTTITEITGIIDQSIWDNLGNGTVTIRFCADDEYDTVGYSEVVVHKDILGPDIIINYPEDGRVFKDIIPSYSITVEDGNLDTVWYTLNGGPEIIVANGTPIVSVSKPIDEEAWNALKEGPVTIQFHANDTLGNLATPKERAIYKSVTNFWEEPWFLVLLLGILAAFVIIIIIILVKYKKKPVAPLSFIVVQKFEIYSLIKIKISRSTKKSNGYYNIKYGSNQEIENHRVNEVKLKKNIDEFNEILNDKDKNVRLKINKLKKVGKSFYRQFFPSEIKKMLTESNFKTIILKLTRDLIHYPWELFHDGEDFLGLKYAIGRKTKEQVKENQYKKYKYQERESKMAGVKFLIIGIPGDDNIPVEEAIGLNLFLNKIENVISKPLVNEEATRDQVEEELEGFDYDFVHYSGHAVFNTRDGAESEIQLYDDKIKAFEINNLWQNHLPILTFMSACETGKESDWKKKSYPNEVFGLASSFFYNGINVIGTLWKVNPAVALVITEAFYTEIFKYQSIGESLRRAKQEAFKEFKSEFLDWASFILYGDPTLTLEKKKEERES